MQSKRVKLREGSVIFREGDPSDATYIVIAGSVKILKKIRGKEHLVAQLGADEMFGEMGVLDGMPRSAAAVAEKETLLESIAAKEFLREIEENPSFAATVMGKLVHRLRGITNQHYDQMTLGGGSDEIHNDPVLPAPDAAASDGSAGSLGATSPNENAAGTAAPAASQKGKAATGTAAPSAAAASQLATPSGPTRSTASKRQQQVNGTIVLPKLHEDTDGHIAAAIATILKVCPGLKVIGTTQPVGNASDFDDPQGLSELGVQARELLATHKGSLAICGRVNNFDENDCTLALINPWPDDEGRLGGVSIHDRLELSGDFLQNDGDFIRAIVLAATQLNDSATGQALQNYLPRSFNDALQSGILNTPGKSGLRRARILACFGNAAAKTSMIVRNGQWMHEAIDAFRRALTTLQPEDRLDRANINLHLAVCLSALGERSKDLETLREAQEACENATSLYRPDSERVQLLTAFARLGAIRYRMGVVNLDEETCRQGVDAFQSALTLCDRNRMADQWADVMNGLGQILQLYGRLARKADLITWAVKVSSSALEVRTREHNPLGWARTQNNLGTAQYLLGQLTGNESNLKAAIQAFDAATEVFESFRNPYMSEMAVRNRSAAIKLLGQISAPENKTG